MPGIRNDVLYGDNVDFTGNWPVTGQITSNGHLLIGSSSFPYIRAGFLTSIDSSVTVTNGPGTIDLSVSSQPIPFSDISSGTPTLDPNHGYFINIPETSEITLPASPSNGDVVILVSCIAAIIIVHANTGQKIAVGSGVSSVAGTVTSVGTIGDSLTLYYRSTDLSWRSTSIIGNWTEA